MKEKTNRALLWTQLYVSLAASWAGLLNGMALSYTSPANPKLAVSRLNVTASEQSFVGSLTGLGAALGGLLSGFAVDIFGRKGMLLYLCLPFTLGWLIVTYANTIYTIYIGRFIVGLGTGADSFGALLYVGEVATPDKRGALASTFQLQATIGIFLTYLIGTWTSWEWLAIISGMFCFVWCVLMYFCIESPLYLVSKYRLEEAQNAIEWLRGKNYDSKHELESLQVQIEEIRQANASWRDLRLKKNLRPLLIVIGCMVFQQFSGAGAVIVNMADIFDAAGIENESLATIIVAIVQIVFTLISVRLIDWLGRKFLLTISGIIVAICLIGLGVYFYLKDNHYDVSGISWVSLVFMIVFIIGMSIGLQPTPWVLVSEMFAPEVKGPASGLATFFSYLFFFIVTVSFHPLKTLIGNAGVYWSYAAIQAIGVFYSRFIVYETKGKTLLEIGKHFAAKNNETQNFGNE